MINFIDWDAIVKVFPLATLTLGVTSLSVILGFLKLKKYGDTNAVTIGKNLKKITEQAIQELFEKEVNVELKKVSELAELQLKVILEYRKTYLENAIAQKWFDTPNEQVKLQGNLDEINKLLEEQVYKNV
jgi:hypothetical protein